VTEDDHGPVPSRSEGGEGNSALYQLDAEDHRAPGALGGKPVQGAAGAVNTGPYRERVPQAHCLLVVRRPRDSHAGPGGVAGAEKSAEVLSVGDPQGSDNEVAPAPMRRSTTFGSQVDGPLAGAGHRAGGREVLPVM
jgi:hypothetical protein